MKRPKASVPIPGLPPERIHRLMGLKLAVATTAKGKEAQVKALIDLGENPVERACIRLVAEVRPDLFEGCKDPVRPLCLLKAILVPLVARGLIVHFDKTSQAGLLWLGPVAAYSLAFERVMLERIFRHRLLSAKNTWNVNDQSFSRGIKADLKLHFARPVREWFDDAPEGFAFWMMRFRQGLHYASRSWHRYVERQSIDVRRCEGILKDAALIGVLRRLESLPEELFSDMLQRFEFSPQARATYQRAIKARVPETPKVELNAWLIEIWPLVLGYGWNFADLQRVANWRFSESEERCIDSPRALKAQCKSLGLTLGRAGSSRVGRPSQSEDKNNGPRLPAMAPMAMRLNTLGDEPERWCMGQALPLPGLVSL